MTGDLREHKPAPNCCLCIQVGSRIPATHSVFGLLVCGNHVGVMQIAGASCMDALDLQKVLNRAKAIDTLTKPIGKQED